MTKKPRFASFVTAGTDKPDDQVAALQAQEGETPIQETAAEPTQVEPAAHTIPPAPLREERRAFSTRIRPSQKATLDAYVMELKRAGWPVSQEAVLEELLRLFAQDQEIQGRITQELTHGAANREQGLT